MKRRNSPIGLGLGEGQGDFWARVLGEFQVAKTSRHEAHGHGSSAILCSSGIYDCHICSSSISSNSNSSNIKCGSNTGHFSMGLLANECKRNAFV